MSIERYPLQEFPRENESSAEYLSPNVSPFPIRKWNEPLPIGVEGIPVGTGKEEPAATKAQDLSRFYPPLLIFSTVLTGVFFFLYLSKPVVVERSIQGSDTSDSASALQNDSLEIVPASVDELVPWPVNDELLKPIQPKKVERVPVSIPDSLPRTVSVPKTERKVEPAREIVVIPFFQPVTEVALDSEATLQAEQIREDLAANRQAAERLREEASVLSSRWSELLSEAQLKAAQ